MIEVKSYSQVPENYTGIIDQEDGTKQWYKKGLAHREDGPAFECCNGTRQWLIEGKFHRTDGPAIEYANGAKAWYINGNYFGCRWLDLLVEKSIFIGTEKGKYGLEWLRFISETGIEEFPIIPGMETCEDFIPVFKKYNITGAAP